jgi:hypothetical protein
MKYATNRPYSDPNRLRAASWSTLRPSNPSREGRIYIEKINGPFLFGKANLLGAAALAHSTVLVSPLLVRLGALGLLSRSRLTLHLPLHIL